MQAIPPSKDFKTTHTGLKYNYFHICIFPCLIFASLCEMLINHLTFPQSTERLKGQFSTPGLLPIRGHVNKSPFKPCHTSPIRSQSPLRTPVHTEVPSAEGDTQMQTPVPAWDPEAPGLRKVQFHGIPVDLLELTQAQEKAGQRGSEC